MHSNLQKLYKCKNCKGLFAKSKPMQIVCGMNCAISLSGSKKAKEKLAAAKSERKEVRARKELLKTRSDYVKDAQKAFNAFIRARDAHYPCISCGVPLAQEAVGGGFDCGHYRSVGSAPHLRFNEHNAHGQCKKCNRYLSGNAVAYRAGLAQRIGQVALDRLEADQSPRRYSKDDLMGLVRLYKNKKKEVLQ